MDKLDKYIKVLSVGLDKTDILFAANLYVELCQLEPSIFLHTLAVARRVVIFNKGKLNEVELAYAIIKTYKDNYKKILQLVNHKADPEAEALAKIAEMVVKGGQLDKDCEITLKSRD